MDNSNNNNRFISPNRFGRLFYEGNESITNNTDSTKTLLNDQIKKEILQKILITMIKIKTLVDRK